MTKVNSLLDLRGAPNKQYVVKVHHFIGDSYTLLLEACKKNQMAAKVICNFNTKFLTLEWKNNDCNRIHSEVFFIAFMNTGVQKLSYDSLLKFGRVLEVIGHRIFIEYKKDLVIKTLDDKEVKKHNIKKNVVTNIKEITKFLLKVKVNEVFRELAETNYDADKNSAAIQDQTVLYSLIDINNSKLVDEIWASYLKDTNYDSKIQKFRKFLLFLEKCLRCISRCEFDLRSQHSVYHAINILFKVLKIDTAMQYKEVLDLYLSETAIATFFGIITNQYEFCLSDRQIKLKAYDIMIKLLEINIVRTREAIHLWSENFK